MPIVIFMLIRHFSPEDSINLKTSSYKMIMTQLYIQVYKVLLILL